jgi:hypothetical protein
LIFNLTKNIRSKLNDDLLQLHAYSQNEEIAFLKLVIGNIPYDLFYFFNTAKTCLFSYADMQDDLTHLPIELLGVHGNTAIGTVYASNIPFISSLITDGKITSPEVKEYIRTQGDVTLFVIYDFID